MVGLRKLNRLDKHRLKATRDAVRNNRSRVDNLHLQLQNLAYEAGYLRSEIDKCLEFKWVTNLTNRINHPGMIRGYFHVFFFLIVVGVLLCSFVFLFFFLCLVQLSRSMHEQIELVPLEEFLETAPEELRSAEASEHEVTMGRLRHELTLRRALATRLETSVSRKKCLVDEIKAKENVLLTIQPTLDNILEAAQPLYSQLGRRIHSEYHKKQEL